MRGSAEIEAYSVGSQQLAFMCIVSHGDDEGHSDDEEVREGKREDSHSHVKDLLDEDVEVNVDEHVRVELVDEMVG